MRGVGENVTYRRVCVVAGGGERGRQGTAGRKQLRRHRAQAERRRLQIQHAVAVRHHPDGPAHNAASLDQVPLRRRFPRTKTDNVCVLSHMCVCTCVCVCVAVHKRTK